MDGFHYFKYGKYARSKNIGQKNSPASLKVRKDCFGNEVVKLSLQTMLLRKVCPCLGRESRLKDADNVEICKCFEIVVKVDPHGHDVASPAFKGSVVKAQLGIW